MGICKLGSGVSPVSPTSSLFLSIKSSTCDAHGRLIGLSFKHIFINLTTFVNLVISHGMALKRFDLASCRHTYFSCAVEKSLKSSTIISPNAYISTAEVHEITLFRLFALLYSILLVISGAMYNLV